MKHVPTAQNSCQKQHHRYTTFILQELLRDEFWRHVNNKE